MMSDNAYAKIVEKVFFDHHTCGDTDLEFFRQELGHAADVLGIPQPKNLGDVIYTFRHRRPLPSTILATQHNELEWVILGAGPARYRFKLVPLSRIVPRADLLVIEIPDATPDLIRLYRLNDKQALLAIVRYNRLIDTFLGLTTYSLQNHLRTQVRGVGHIEIDEVYVGLDKRGRHYLIPVQAKAGKDQIGTVQVDHDIQYVTQKFPNLECRSIAAQFMPDETVVMFELTLRNGAVKVVDERHYCLVSASEFTGRLF